MYIPSSRTLAVILMKIVVQLTISDKKTPHLSGMITRTYVKNLNIAQHTDLSEYEEYFCCVKDK